MFNFLDKIFIFFKTETFVLYKYTNVMNYLCRDPSHSYECFQTPRRGCGSTSGSFFLSFFFFFFFFVESCYSILVVSVVFCRSFCLSTLFLLSIVFYVLRFVASGYKIDTFKLLFGLIFYLHFLGIL